MLKKQESYLLMFISVIKYLAQFIKITSGIVGFDGYLQILTDTVPKIQATGELQKVSLKGITKGKNIIKANLLRIAADNARKLKAYANETKNSILFEEIAKCLISLRNASETDLKDFAQLIYDRADSNKGSLDLYKITDASLLELANVLASYNKMLADTDVARIKHAETTKKLAELFAIGIDALNHMDLLIETVRETEVDFYNGYRSSRRIISLPTGTISVRGLILDAETGEPRKGAKITLSLVSTGGKAVLGSEPIMKKSAKKGGFNVANATEGTYTITVNDEGCEIETSNIIVKDGELTRITIKLKKK